MRPAPSPEKSTQRNQILALLVEARGDWVPAPELARLALQFQTRIKEIRDQLGLKIENQIQRQGRKQLSRYRLVLTESTSPPRPTGRTAALNATRSARVPEHTTELVPPSSDFSESTATESPAESLFGDLSVDRSYRE